MPLLNIPEELIELRSSVGRFIDREIRPLEESHRPEIQETGTFEGMRDERLKLRKRSAELGFWTLHMPEEVGGGGLSWETPLSTWEWVFGVNIWGVVHGLRTFVPLLMQRPEAYIVNTASAAGLR